MGQACWDGPPPLLGVPFTSLGLDLLLPFSVDALISVEHVLQWLPEKVRGKYMRWDLACLKTLPSAPILNDSLTGRRIPGGDLSSQTLKVGPALKPSCSVACRAGVERPGLL